MGKGSGKKVDSARLSYRLVGSEAAELLAEMNSSLIQAEGSDNPMTLEELRYRMNAFLLEEGYQAALFEYKGAAAEGVVAAEGMEAAGGGNVVGYVLYRVEPAYTYVRQFYVSEKMRGKGVGSAMFARMRDTEWAQAAEIQLDVLEGNRGALGFWEGHGFEPRARRMRLGTAGRSSTRKSCGAIIYRRSLMGIRYLLLRHENGGHWSFPKGHTEKGESERETAVREIHEETGLHPHFRHGFYERIYYLTPKGRRKEVVYFLARVWRPRVREQVDEISEHRWASYAEARSLLTFENTRLLLDKAHLRLTGRGPDY
jgi:8-oxo-dGTP pyrophosphatase MutT (NUDIX family)/predicted GNAT family acetyltransferase